MSDRVTFNVVGAFPHRRFPIANCQLPIVCRRVITFKSAIGNRKSAMEGRPYNLFHGILPVLGLILLSTFGSYVYAQTPPGTRGTVQKEAGVTTRASGTFEVKMTPQTSGIEGIGRMSIDKQFQGDLKGTSKAEMLAVNTGVKDSAGYVAMEQVTGTLNGRTGSFVLQHSGTMTRGAPQLSVTVVPDSGTGELKGISGRMTIIIAGGKHSYEFEYTITPDANE